MVERRRTSTAIRFPEELHARLAEAARERGFSINFLVVKAVEEFLERLVPADELRLTYTPEEYANRVRQLDKAYRVGSGLEDT